MSVNVGVQELIAPEFADMVLRLLADRGLESSALMLEITETSMIEEFEQARGAVAVLRRQGVAISIDDFGAGFTSLAYLSQLSVAEVKLDRRFIIPLAGGVQSRDSELVRATIELCHALGLDVVAEGVEDDQALRLLQRLGCDIAQGYGVGRPAAADRLSFEPVPNPSPALIS